MHPRQPDNTEHFPPNYMEHPTSRNSEPTAAHAMPQVTLPHPSSRWRHASVACIASSEPNSLDILSTQHPHVDVPAETEGVVAAASRGKPPRAPRQHPLRVNFVTTPSVKTFDSEQDLLHAQEMAMDRLLAAEADYNSPLHVRAEDLADKAFIAAEQKRVDDEQRQKNMLPPPYGAGYIVQKSLSPFTDEGMRIVFKVDSGCEPFNIIRRDAVVAAGLTTRRKHIRLHQASGEAISAVDSEEVVDFYLRVNINERPRLMHIECAVWETCLERLIISQTTALRTGLTLFVHDNEFREAIMGKHSLFAEPLFDNLGEVRPVCATIIGEREDEEMMERISPLESIRAAMAPAVDKTDDPWVTEELHGPRREVFGPLAAEPAAVPYLEFDVDEEAVRQHTYGNTQTIKLPTTSPHSQDVLRAHWNELKGYNVLAEAYPDVTPGPIASIAFTVPKPDSKRVPRPHGYCKNPQHPLSEDIQRLWEEYTASLTADRLVVNFQPVNRFITIQHFPMPTVQENLAKLARFTYYAKLDVTKAYWGIGVHPRCRKWLYTIAPGGLSGYWLRAPMGCAAVAGWFQYTITGVLKKQEQFTLCYADDIFIMANSAAELKRRISEVLQRLLDVGFRVNAKKCQFYPQRSISYLGWVITDRTVMPAEGALDKLWRIRKPSETMGSDKTKRSMVRKFLGTILYLGNYIPFHAEQLRPLHELTRTKDSADDPISKAQRTMLGPSPAKLTRKFVWNEAADKAWDWGVERIRSIKPLACPSFAEDTWLETFSDAAKLGWGGILVEFRKGNPLPFIIGCVAGTFTSAQLNWPIIQKECMAAWATVRRFRPYLHLSQFVINVDHRNLLWMAMSANEVVVRMATDLQQHRFVLRHCDGEENAIADMLSRAQHVSPEEYDRLKARHQAKLEERGNASVFANSDSGNSDSSWEEHLHSLTRLVGVAAPLRADQAPAPRRRQRRAHRQDDPPLVLPDREDDDLPIVDVGADIPQAGIARRRIPTDKWHILKAHHGGQNPHLTVGQLAAALREGGYNWPEMELDCQTFVITCHACQLERLRRRGPEALPYRSIVIPSSLFDVWSFDILGPLPPCSLTGCTYIFVGVEETSKLTVLDAAVEKSTLEVMFFWIHCFKFFGLPRIIRTDCDAAFISRVCQDFAHATGITHEFGIAYRHQSDGVVENAASIVWPYLRLAAFDLQKYSAWTPLLGNVMLGVNALARDVLGGASASEIVFNRKVRPMRFLRPEALPDRDPPPGVFEPRYVNTFIADNASQQLRAIARAHNERHLRFVQQSARQAEAADGVEHLNWVRVGILVSIPQPEFEARRRPNKWAFLRCGPYEITAISEGGGTVTLRDATIRAQPIAPFTWPTCWLFPYHSANVPPPLELHPPPEDPQQDDLPPFIMDSDFDIALAILDHRPLPHILDGLPRTHVKNHVYKVRWRGKRHTEDTWEPYEAVWHQFAFGDFITGSQLTGHIAPSAYARAHRQHVNALLRNQAPERDVALVDPHAIDNDLRDYVILEHQAPRNSRSLQASQQQHQAEQAHHGQSQEHIAQLNQSQADENVSASQGQPPPALAASQMQASSPAQLSIPILAQRVEFEPARQSNDAGDSAARMRRRTNRPHRPSSFGPDFTN
jgi:hypothetical protein